MDEARIEQATGRIQAALARIERAASSAADTGPANRGAGERDVRIRTAMQQLDALIESLEA